jgi:imidazolonepropionase-like amidohydrolase
MYPTSFIRHCLAALLLLTSVQVASEGNEQALLVFENVNIFNGKDDRLIKGCKVVVEGNLIKEACASDVEAGGSVKFIDGQGMTLMPGLIDSHVHFYLSMDGGRPAMEAARWDYMASMGAAAASEWIADGFTTVRDMGGALDGLRTVIDAGLIDGPRMYLAGATISQSSGHADMTLPGMNNVSHYANLVRLQVTKIADGEDEVRKAVRQTFSTGSNFTKIMIGSGVAGSKSPMFSSQYSDAEIIAAVEEASSKDGYVAAHIYLDEHIKRALRLGVKTIEHGQYIQEDTARMLKKQGAYISPFLASIASDEIFKHPIFGNRSLPFYARTLEMKEGTKDFIAIMQKVRPKIVFSSDIVNTNGLAARRHRDHEKWVFAKSFGNLEALRAMTSVPGELAMETGRANPYPHPLGVIENGAYADILLVDGNPLEDITVLGASPEWFNAPPREKGEIPTIRVIMKDGNFFKNTL